MRLENTCKSHLGCLGRKKNYSLRGLVPSLWVPRWQAEDKAFLLLKLRTDPPLEIGSQHVVQEWMREQGGFLYMHADGLLAA